MTTLAGERAGIDAGDAPERAAALTRAWLAEHLPAGWVRAAPGGRPPYRAGAPDEAAYRAWYPRLAGSGLVVPGWPREAFGLRLGPAQVQAVNRELRAAGVVRLAPLDLHRAGPTLLRWATPEQQTRFLPGIVAGVEAWTQLFSEPGAGSDLPSLSTRAVRDGDEWVVTGQKVWSSYAGWSTYGMLLARTDPDAPKRQGITYFVIEMDQPGIDARPLVQMTGDAEFFEVFLDGARVLDSNRIGPVGRGWDVARTTLAGERTVGGDASSPGSTRSLDGLIDERRDRDGGRVASPVHRQRLAALAAARRVNGWTNQRLAGQPGAATLASSGGKLHVSGYTTALRTTWVELAGAYGAACDEDDRRQLRTRHDFLAHPAERIAGGSDEIQRNTVGENVLGLPREPDPYHGRPWVEIPRS
ncbi:MAG: acyl-CoA dehydrogenase family protein [Acidimicrobiales bacterium]